MTGFNLGLELRSGLLAMVRESLPKVVRRQHIIILILPRGNGFPALVVRRLAPEIEPLMNRT